MWPFSKVMVPAEALMAVALWFTLSVQGGPAPGVSKADLSSWMWMSMRWKLLYSFFAQLFVRLVLSGMEGIESPHTVPNFSL
jgi:hypothetical protein